jgi:hypothetical protein
MRFVRAEFAYLALKIIKNTKRESLEPRSTQWGLAFSSPMPLSVYGFKMRKNMKPELKGVFG